MTDTRTILEFEGEKLVLTHPCMDCGTEIAAGQLCPACISDRIADSEDYEQFEADDIEDGFEDCGLMPDGQCMNAGTEECDFECPNRNSELFAGSAAYNRKHGIM